MPESRDKKNIHDGHRKRIRAEFMEKGMDHFAPHEKLEMLLFFSKTRGNTNEEGHRLMDRFGSLSGVFDAPYHLLLETEGIGAHSACLIKVVGSLVKAYMEDYANHNNVIDSYESAKEYMKYKFLTQPLECIYMACLGNNGKVVLCDMIAEGTPEQVGISSQTVMRKAVAAGAVRVVLAHNHPNGLCNPSSQDLTATNVVKKGLVQVNVQLFDHVIVAADGVCSMGELGMLSGLNFR